MMNEKIKNGISKMLTLSIRHISQDTVDFLEYISDLDGCDNPDLIVYKSEHTQLGYGFFVSTLSLGMKDMPADLYEVLKLAEDNDCNWLCLSTDGIIVPGLTEYERYHCGVL